VIPPLIRERIRIMMSAVMVAMVLLLGLARNDGLVLWTIRAYEEKIKLFTPLLDSSLRGVCLADRTTARMLGCWACWLRSPSKHGEVIQGKTTWRSEELADWIAGAIGSAAAVVPYLLCMGLRACANRRRRKSPHAGEEL